MRGGGKKWRAEGKERGSVDRGLWSRCAYGKKFERVSEMSEDDSNLEDDGRIYDKRKKKKKFFGWVVARTFKPVRRCVPYQKKKRNETKKKLFFVCLSRVRICGSCRGRKIYGIGIYRLESQINGRI